MSASLDANFTPPRHAVQAWVDERNIFIAIPVKTGLPFIDRYPLTAAGLGEALAKMRNYHTVSAGPPIYQPPARPSARVAKPAALSNDRRLALAQDILKRLIITPKRG